MQSKKHIRMNEKWRKHSSKEILTRPSSETVCDDSTICKNEMGCARNPQKPNSYICLCPHTGKLPKNGTCERFTVTTPFPVPVLEQNYTRTGFNITSKISVFNVHILNKTAHGGLKSRVDNLNEFSSYPNPLTVFIVTTISISLLFILLTTLCFIKRKTISQSIIHKFRGQKKKRQDIFLNNSRLLPPDRFIMNPTYEVTHLISDLSVPVYLESEITILEQIGQGCFGRVFKGELNNDEVAVKVLKKQHALDALKEVETMAGFNHPNILKLIGVADEENDGQMLIFEFMTYGDLANVLRSASGISDIKRDMMGENSVIDEKTNFLSQLNTDSLLSIVYQIAEGMSYLASQHFVHRDLAARNCLVGHRGVVKVSDFGLSRDVYTCDYYRIGGSRLLPIRWMSPESVLYGRFTLESDVWAFGILLWEIYTWGKQPYYGHGNTEVVQLILDGVLLCPPHDCPQLICSLMAGCWKTDPKHRLSFNQILNQYFHKNIKRNDDHDQTGTEILAGSGEGEYEVPKPKQDVDYMEVI